MAQLNQTRKKIHKSIKEITLLLPVVETGYKSGIISHKWINISEFTNYPTIYFEIIRVLCFLLPIECVRNPSNAKEGFYLIGRQVNVHYTSNWITEFIQSAELDILRYKNQKIYKKSKIHGNSAITNFRHELVKLFAFELKQLSPFDEYYEERKLFKEYIKETNLRTKKLFRGKQN